jgi:YbbR domain-containing protein
LEDFFIHNWKRKLAAFALVAVAWFFLASQQEVKITVNAPVQFDNPPAGLLAGPVSEGSVDLTLSGRQSEIRALEKKGVHLRVNLMGFSEGKHKIRLSGKNVDLPSGVTIQEIIPPSIEVNLTRN